jgi:hypothetical protein
MPIQAPGLLQRLVNNISRSLSTSSLMGEQSEQPNGRLGVLLDTDFVDEGSSPDGDGVAEGGITQADQKGETKYYGASVPQNRRRSLATALAPSR